MKYSFLTGSSGDTTPPVITNVVNSTADCTSVMISWNTDELATTQVEYSTTDGFTLGSGTRVPNPDPDGANTMFHSYGLTGLSSNTTYYYIVISMDGSANQATSTQSSFTTAASCDTTPPNIIDGPRVSGISDSTATINWGTDELATSQVEYSTTDGFTLGTGTRIPTTDSDGANKSEHSVLLNGLTGNTVYYYRVITKDGSGNQTVSSQGSFTTADPTMDGWETVQPSTACGGSFGKKRNTVSFFGQEVFFGGRSSADKASLSISDSTQTDIDCSSVGLGNNSFQEVSSAAVASFNGTNYIYFSAYGSQGGGLSRSLDGDTFTSLADGGGTSCTSSGLGDGDNDIFTAMSGGVGYLYLGSLNTSDGARLYVADDDEDDGTACDFTDDNTGGNGFIFDGAATETQISSIALYEGNVYIGVRDTTNGAKLYRAAHNPGGAYSWTDVTPASFTSATLDIPAMHIYNGKLWIGTENASGGELYSYDGSTETKIIDFDASDKNDAANRSISFIQSNGVNYLYFGTTKSPGSGGAELWRSADAGVTFSQSGSDGLGNTDRNAAVDAGSSGNTIYFVVNDETNNESAIFRKTDG